MTETPTPLAELELSAAAAHRWVCQQLNRRVSRTTFYRWRAALGWVGDDFRTFPPAAVEALAVFGYWADAARSLDVAKTKAVQHYRQSKVNHQGQS